MIESPFVYSLKGIPRGMPLLLDMDVFMNRT